MRLGFSCFVIWIRYEKGNGVNAMALFCYFLSGRHGFAGFEAFCLSIDPRKVKFYLMTALSTYGHFRAF